jgi:hypothetical protein
LIVQPDKPSRTDACGILATLAAIRDQLEPSALKLVQ